MKTMPEKPNPARAIAMVIAIVMLVIALLWKRILSRCVPISPGLTLSQRKYRGGRPGLLLCKKSGCPRFASVLWTLTWDRGPTFRQMPCPSRVLCERGGPLEATIPSGSPGWVAHPNVVLFDVRVGTFDFRFVPLQQARVPGSRPVSRTSPLKPKNGSSGPPVQQPHSKFHKEREI